MAGLAFGKKLALATMGSLVGGGTGKILHAKHIKFQSLKMSGGK